MRNKWKWVIFGAIFMWIMNLSITVYSHAYITNANPGENEILEEPPKEIKIEFNEKIQTGFAILRVLNSSGEKVDKGNVVIDEKTQNSLQVDLQEKLPEDIYTVEWRVVSADGHSVSGIIPFSIGELPEGASFPEQKASMSIDNLIPVFFNKIFLYSGLCIYMGVILFCLVWYREKISSQALLKARIQKVSRYAILFLALSVLSFLIIQTKSNAGISYLQAIKPSYLKETLVNTKEGMVWFIQLILLAFIVVSQFRLQKKDAYDKKMYWIFSGLSLTLLMLSKAFVGHPSSSPYEFAAIIFDFMHLLAASIWVGGIIVIVFMLREGIRNKEGDANAIYWHTISTYSIWALVSFAVIGISGAINASLLIPDFHSLVYTTYGRVLLIKVGLLFIMMLFGAYHLIARTLVNRQTFFKKTIKMEMMLGVLILITTSFFTQIQTPTLPLDMPFYEEAEYGFNQHMSLSISPKKTGMQNQFEILLFDNKRNSIDGMEQVSIQLTNGDTELSFPLKQEDEGYYSAQNLQLNQPGKWKIVVHFLTTELDTKDLSFEMEVR